MLAVFEEIKVNEKSWFKRKIHDLFPPAPTGILEVVEGIPYIRISCKERKKGIPWKKISEISMDCSGRILLPVGINPPENCQIKRFVPLEFPQRMLEKLAYNTLSDAKITPSKISLAICASALEVQRILPSFMNFSSEIRVISKDAEALNDFVDKTADMTGAAIMLTDDESAADSCNIILAPSGLPEGAKGNKDAIVFACGRTNFLGTQILGVDLDIPDWIKPAYRKCYDKMEFLSAFYEIARSRKMESLLPKKAIGRAGSISDKQLGEILQELFEDE